MFTSTKSKSGILALALALGSTQFVPVCFAQSSQQNRAAARATAEAGLDAFHAGDFAKAEELLLRAEAAYHAPVHLLYIAKSQTAQGKLVAAKETYLKLLNEDVSDNSPEAIEEALTQARTDLSSVDARLAKLTIVIKQTESSTLNIKLDGADISNSLIGLPIPVNPNPHELTIFVDGALQQSVQIELAEGAEETITIDLDKNTKSEVVNGQVVTPPAEEKADLKENNSPASWYRPAAIGSWGLGAVGIGFGIGFLIDSMNKHSDANALYDSCGLSCQDETTNLDQQSADSATISLISFIAGGAFAAAGTGFWIMGSPSESKGVQAHLQPLPGGFRLDGRF